MSRVTTKGGLLGEGSAEVENVKREESNDLRKGKGSFSDTKKKAPDLLP